MKETVLVTGGMGFIGRYVVDELLAEGHRVRILDNFNEQVHADGKRRQRELRGKDCEVLDGDVRDGGAVRCALDGVDSVIHLAAEVGVGQSMYEIERYVDANERGTAVLLQHMLERPIRRIVVASSMSVYGEGLYESADGLPREDVRRETHKGVNGFASWDPVDESGRRLTPVPTPEWKRPSLSSVYALNKYAQEQMTLLTAPAYGIEAVALRLFNVYGAGQALSNPYTGVLAIFGARLLNRRQPLIFEDGAQQRDFVHVEDVARAFVAALKAPGVSGEVFNIGSGAPISISDLAQRFSAAMGVPDIAAGITGKFRTGDIRHCFADISHARAALGYRPQHDLETGLPQLAEWVATQTAEDNVSSATAELAVRGLVT